MAREASDTPSERAGFVDSVKSWAANLVGTTRSRLDSFTSDVEERVFRIIARLMWSLVAFVSLTLGLVLAMLTIVFGFGLPPRYAFGIPAVVFLLIGSVAVIMIQKKKSPK